MRRAAFGAALLLGGCSAQQGTFHEKLYQFANAGMVRVGDMEHRAIRPAQVHTPRECAVFLKPDGQVQRAAYQSLSSLCLKDDFRRGAEVATIVH